ncbi:MAG: YabP/YqfC family sporulation protein [Clostridia bacterium]|nr:YabP/YqfC family sporulation protein [Clostridia bacterium]
MAKKLKIDTNKKKEKWNIFGSGEGISKALLTGPRMEFFSNNQMILEGCLGIYEYNDNYLKLRLSHGALVLVGEDFDIVSFEEKTITVRGKFSSLEFCV